MKKKYAILLAFLITGLIASNFFLFQVDDKNNLETVIVSRAIDGDTLELQDGRRVRLLNVNSPEKSTSLSELSIKYLRALENSTVQMGVTGKDKYSRTLARIYTPDYLNLKLVSLGLSSKFLVVDSELTDFAKAEELAISEEQGIWNHSTFYDCIKSQIDKNSELLVIESKCGPLEVKNWILKDESRKEFKFSKEGFTRLIIHSNEGNSNTTDMYWGEKTNIWNNDRDSLYLFDQLGFIIHYNSYGY